MNIEPRILEILTRVRPEAVWGDSSNFLLDGLIDSFDIILITSFIEKDFSIKIPGDEIRSNNFKNLETLTALVARVSK